MVERVQSLIRVPTAPVAIPRSSSTAILGQAAANLGRVGMDVAAERLQRRAQADDAIALARASAEYETGLLSLERDAQGQAGPGGDGYLEAVQTGRQELRQRVLDSLPGYVSEMGMARIEQAFVGIEASSTVRSVAWADEQNKDWRVDSLQTAANVRHGRIEADPDSAQAQMRELAELVAASGLAPDERRAVTRAMIVDVAQASISGFLAQGRVDEAFGVIDSMAADLTPGEQRALDKAIDDWIEERADATVDPADAHDKEVTRLLYGPEQNLPEALAYLQANGGEMDADDYGQHMKAWRNLAMEGPQANAVGLTDELEVIAAIESGEAISIDALNTIIRDKVADGTWDSANVARVRAASEAMSDDVLKAGLDVVSAALGQAPGAMTWDNLLAVQESEARNAVIEFRQANPEATRQEIRDEAFRIAARVKNDVLATMPPLEIGGQAYRPRTLEEVDTLQELLNASDLTMADKAEAQELIQRYRDRLIAGEIYGVGP